MTILTAEEVSEITKIPYSTVCDLAKQGEIPGRKIGRHWRFLESDIYHMFTEKKETKNQKIRRRLGL